MQQNKSYMHKTEVMVHSLTLQRRLGENLKSKDFHNFGIIYIIIQ